MGLILSAGAVTLIEHQFYEILIGFGIAGTGFGVVHAVVGRAKPMKTAVGLLQWRQLQEAGDKSLALCWLLGLCR